MPTKIYLSWTCPPQLVWLALLSDSDSLNELVSDCSDLSDDLLDVSKAFQAKTPSRREASKVVLKHFCEADEIEHMLTWLSEQSALLDRRAQHVYLSDIRQKLDVQCRVSLDIEISTQLKQLFTLSNDIITTHERGLYASASG
ncbi:hypothetical protein BKA67DRAFT_98174 [Truncatella angustata]|uniref:Uncharacterized protein n=1 Tax=Truncatella angustata TaxID=152316 RepID=A0A9P8RN99_9PEZI|nr:uncharacterized protein BKA67DRAFT_98174 [Truncatella angustata]KAH6646286.1 hypothetical protein BKA67DRAFT_98174 [Truncatella angustata]